MIFILEIEPVVCTAGNTVHPGMVHEWYENLDNDLLATGCESEGTKSQKAKCQALLELIANRQHTFLVH